MKTWEAFYPDVLPELLGAPFPTVDQCLRNAASEFCERSKAIRVVLDAEDGEANQGAYLLSMPTNAVLVKIIGVTYAGEKLSPAAPATLAGKYGNWRAEAGTPEYFLEYGGELLLVPMPENNAAAAIVAEVAYKPGSNAGGIDDWIYARWRSAIAAGGKAQMMAMLSTPWANAAMATVYASLFERAINEAATSANNGFTGARPRFSGKFC